MKTIFKTTLILGVFWLINTSSHGFAQMLTPTELPNNNFCDIDATIINNDSVCRLVWSNPRHWYYDDGSCDDFAIWTTAGGECVVKFELPSGPSRLIGAEIFVGDGSFPTGSNFLGNDFLLVAYDDDGEEGLPGTLLDSVIITVDNYNWVACEGLNVSIDDSIFYLGMRQILPPMEAAPIGIDTDLPTKNYSYIKMPFGGSWQLSPYQDFMIRALTCVDNKQPGQQAQKDYFDIVVSRVSDFDPTIGETPDDGVLTVIDSIIGYPPFYSDTSFVSLPTGHYAYGLKRYNIEDSTSIGWNYSNTVLHPVGITDNEFTKPDIIVYPNPANKMVYLKTKTGKNHMVNVVNITGRIVFELDLPTSGNMLVDVSNWPRGMYLFNIFEDGRLYGSEKVIVR